MGSQGFSELALADGRVTWPGSALTLQRFTVLTSRAAHLLKAPQNS